MAAGGEEGSDGGPCVSVGCATAAAVEVCEGSLPHCTSGSSGDAGA